LTQKAARQIHPVRLAHSSNFPLQMEFTGIVRQSQETQLQQGVSVP